MDPKLSFRTVCISKAKKHPLEEGSLLFISCWPVKGSRFLISSQTAKKFYLDHIWLLTSFLFFFVTGMFWTILSSLLGLFSSNPMSEHFSCFYIIIEDYNSPFIFEKKVHTCYSTFWNICVCVSSQFKIQQILSKIFQLILPI